MKHRYTYIIILSFLCNGCGSHIKTDVPQEQVGETFQTMLQEALDTSFDMVPGVSASIISDQLTQPWNGVAGYDSIAKEDSLGVHQAYRIASVTKTFVAVSILRLHEMDSLSIEDSISDYVSTTHQDILRSDGYNVEDIKIKHCLNHSSGIFDYAMGNRKYIEHSIGQPNKRWTRTEQIQFAVDHGDKLWEVNGGYRYSDTGYVLLGEIIESFFDGDLALGLRTLLDFKALGLEHTWLETLEPQPIGIGEPVHRYLRRDDVTEYDPSNDLFGGGGLMSTSEDLSKFVSALFEGRIFEKQSTLDLMLAGHALSSVYDPMTDERFKDYRYGMWKIKMFGYDGYMHGGLWGTKMLYLPELKTACVVNYTKGSMDRLIKKLILVVVNQKENN